MARECINTRTGAAKVGNRRALALWCIAAVGRRMSLDLDGVRAVDAVALLDGCCCSLLRISGGSFEMLKQEVEHTAPAMLPRIARQVAAFMLTGSIVAVMCELKD